MRHSAVWAAVRTRADLVSSLPLDVYTRQGAYQVEVSRPPVLVEPGGPRWDYTDWMWASQSSFDRAGNNIGLITAVNGLGLPARIDLQDPSLCTVIQRKGESKLTYRIDGVEYDESKVWHERQYPVAGLPVGLSPIAYAALSLGEYMSAQQFALDWFGGSGVPKARLRNKERKVPPKDSAIIKDQWRRTVDNGDLFVYGNDWEYDLMQAEVMGVEWLELRRYGLTEVSRFLGVPADLLDAAISAPGTITYQTALQRNLQFLVMQLGPTIQRREKNLSKLLPRPRFVKLNSDALLRMDQETQAKVIESRIRNRTLTVTEARALYNLPPLTPDQEAEFARLFPKLQTPAKASNSIAVWEQVSPMSAVPYSATPVGALPGGIDE